MATKKPVKTSAITGEPAGHLLALSMETNLPDPYVISDSITVEPPSKTSAQAMNDAHQAVVVYGAMLTGMMQRPDGPAGSTELAEVSALIRKAEDDYNRAFFGDAHDAVMEFFAHRPQPLWEAFAKDIRAHFLPSEPADDKDERIAQLAAALAELAPEHDALVGKEPASST